MSTPIAFVDCETTHLDAELGDAWEVAVILRDRDDNATTDTEYVWQIRPDLTTADPESLKVGRYLERFAVPVPAEAAWTGYEDGPVLPMTRAEVVGALLNVLGGAVLVGSNPGFDDRFLRRLLGPGSARWHYRPSDEVPFPFSSRDLSRWTGVEPPGGDVAHTALGDARWARDVFDAVTGGAA